MRPPLSYTCIIGWGWCVPMPNDIRVTYIDHSGFFLEWEDCCFLFDYYKGDLPEPVDKPLIVFSSHSHPDHFNPAIFDYGSRWRDAAYVLSEEIPVPKSAAGRKVYRLGGLQRLSLPPDVQVETLPSTDLGVAYLVAHRGRTVYHAGDLHWWLWDECTKEENEEMTRMFREYTRPLQGRRIDVAFLPLDPRQREDSWKGFDYYMRLCKIRWAVPMHFWGRFRCIEELCRRKEAAAYADRIVRLRQKGDHYAL